MRSAIVADYSSKFRGMWSRENPQPITFNIKNGRILIPKKGKRKRKQLFELGKRKN